MFYIGCPMWGYKGWVGNFFPASTPASDFLRLYSRKMTTVEGNTSFYALPTSQTITHWRSKTPPGFHFCPKVSRDISHAQRLDSRKNETLIFTERMRGLAARLGPMFLQLPPAFAPGHLPQLEAFLDFWPPDLRLAIEVRHPAFFEAPQAEALNTLLSRHHVARVIMDSRPIRIGSTEEQGVLQARERKPDLPLDITVTADFTFVRYIGNPHPEVNDPLLDAWAQQFAQWLQQGKTLYVFCHCPFEIHSPLIGLDLYQRVSQLVPLPALPSHSEKPENGIEQGRLF